MDPVPAKLARAHPRACRCFFTHSLTPPLLGGRGVGDGTGALPPPVSASTSVEIAMPIAVRIDLMVIPYSRKSIRIRSASVLSSWRSSLMVSRILPTCDRRAATFAEVASSLACISSSRSEICPAAFSLGLESLLEFWGRPFLSVFDDPWPRTSPLGISGPWHLTASPGC